MAAGKSTLAKELATREKAVLLVQDEFLDSLYPGEISDIPDFVRCSSRLKDALEAHVCALLKRGIPVVLDFPGNTRAQRAWFRTNAAYLPARRGRRMRNSMRSPSSFSLHRTMKASTWSATRARSAVAGAALLAMEAEI